ncbi:hypothetical protein BGX28_006045 [Mortierella sp. GBA30]|nr:hypothetical protein BGX28_006045 [Mortierella sp. GBA30]
MGGVLFSLDEEPKEFNEDMYLAMRNRIFELEAKTVNYAPFNRPRKRSVDRSDMTDEYPGHSRHHHSPYGYGHGPLGHHSRYGHGHDPGETEHYSKRQAYNQAGHPHHPEQTPPRSSTAVSREGYVCRHVPSYPSWYTPETYLSPSHPPHPCTLDRELEQRHLAKAQSGANLEGPSSRPPSPPSNNAASSQISTSSAAGAPNTSSSPASSNVSVHAAQPPAIQPRPIQPYGSNENASHSASQANTLHANRHSPTSHPSRHYTQHPEQRVLPSASTQAAHTAAVAAAAAAVQQQRQSFHQRQHRAQQQAQSDYSRSYHLQKHLRMIDQQRAAQLAQQKQQQEQQQQQQQQQSFKIQRHYQSHQRMYPHTSSPQSLQTQKQQQQQHQQQQQVLRGATFHHQQQQATQQQLIQRYREQQRQLQQKKQQQQVRQLQYLRQRTAAAQAAASVSVFTPSLPASAMSSFISSSALSGGTTMTDKVDMPTRQRSVRPLECSNCMALDSLTWQPTIEASANSATSAASAGSGPEISTAEGVAPRAEGKLLCPTCMQYWQAHGKCRPVPPYRTNFLKKIHCRFKKELQEVRFQGWQDAQVIEVEDQMTDHEFQAVFRALPGDDMGMRSRQASVLSNTSTAASSPVLRAAGAAIHLATSTTKAATAEEPEKEPIVIKIEDDEDEDVTPLSASALTKASSKIEELAFQSEAAVGDLFGHRWKTEPMVGYTLVHFGGSDRTRMVPMNPTVPSLTVAFSPATESVTFTFRVLVNGLCLLSSGGGPPALHMPEMADDEESGEEEEEEQESSATPADPQAPRISQEISEPLHEEKGQPSDNDDAAQTSTAARDVEVE